MLKLTSVLPFLFGRESIMNIEKRPTKDGTNSYRAVGRYVDPLTGKRRKATLRFESNTPRGRHQAKLDLRAKIDDIIAERQGQSASETVTTFGKLRDLWLESWAPSVKPMTVAREKTVLKRLNELMSDDLLLSAITPMLVQKLMNDYKEKYGSTFSTMQHIKCTINKIFDFGVLHGIIQFSPSKPVKLRASVAEKQAIRQRREDKFLNQKEIHVLLGELKKRRNLAYYDMVIFMVATGCRIGEAGALTVKDIDFKKKTVSISKSLQTHDLKVEDYYDDSTKTMAGERIEQLPDVALDAVQRCLARNKIFDMKRQEQPSEAFHASESLFRTEYGSPISSHALREILGRVNNHLKKHCLEEYGFEWTKNAIPHSFRHTHISVLRNDANIPLKEVQERVGHVLAETTDGYTHEMTNDQSKSVLAISKFIGKVG